ncbi:hypothetical protein E2320_001216 [Naja naja]|nr:hypothetical protein E2320_001216 [Naja naja]
MAAFRPSSAAPSEQQSLLENCTVLDEFTAPAEKSGFLERSRGGLERLFGVHLALLEAAGGGVGGGWAPSDTGGRRIWLSLLGEREKVRSAKEYIKGICEPELEGRENYPKDMHCIFVGAQNLFLNCLIKGTSADITVLEIGTLGIKGRTEPVVMARSHIQQFVNLFKSNLNDLTVKESEVKKQFKCLVEAHADKYTMDLLILPSSLKKELLSLAQHEGSKAEGRMADPGPSNETLKHPTQMPKLPVVSSDGKTGQEEARNNAGTPVSELAKQMDTVFPDTRRAFFTHKRSNFTGGICLKRKAVVHGLQKFFSCRGIAIAVDYFWKRGHRKITVFVPQWRTRKDSNITDFCCTLLKKLEVLLLPMITSENL